MECVTFDNKIHDIDDDTSKDGDNHVAIIFGLGQENFQWPHHSALIEKTRLQPMKIDTELKCKLENLNILKVRVEDTNVKISEAAKLSARLLRRRVWLHFV